MTESEKDKWKKIQIAYNMRIWACGVLLDLQKGKKKKSRINIHTESHLFQLIKLSLFEPVHECKAIWTTWSSTCYMWDSGTTFSIWMQLLQSVQLSDSASSLYKQAFHIFPWEMVQYSPWWEKSLLWKKLFMLQKYKKT